MLNFYLIAAKELYNFRVFWNTLTSQRQNKTETELMR